MGKDFKSGSKCRTVSKYPKKVDCTSPDMTVIFHAKPQHNIHREKGQVSD